MHRILVFLSTLLIACTTTTVPPVSPPIDPTEPLIKVWQVEDCETGAVLWTDVNLFVNREGLGQQILIDSTIFVATGRTANLSDGSFYWGEAKYAFGCPDLTIEPVIPNIPSDSLETFQPLAFVLIKVKGKRKYVYRPMGSKIVVGTPITFAYKAGKRRSGAIAVRMHGGPKFYNIPEIKDPYNLTRKEIKSLRSTTAVSDRHTMIEFDPTWGQTKIYKFKYFRLRR